MKASTYKDSDTPSMDLFGQSLWDFLHGDSSAEFQLHRDDGLVDAVPVSIFFQSFGEMTQMERKALDMCAGRVLDIGAGAGRHALILQERGVRVTAIDVSRDAVEVMRACGVREVIHGDFLEFSEGPYDTLLLMMRSIGMAGDLTGLDRFLRTARRCLAPGGQIITDAVDFRMTDNPVHLTYQEANLKAGRYEGEVRLRVEYKGEIGLPYKWLLVEEATLVDFARKHGFSCTTLYREPKELYLARLQLPGMASPVSH